ncbi:hypothetical protein ACOSP7_017474 [Xanthoceras sorbifolium]
MAASGTSSNHDAAANNSSVINQLQALSFLNHLNFNLPLKLDHDNYVIWKSQVLPAIRAYDLEEFILGESICPMKFVEKLNEETGDFVRSINEEFLKWKKTDQLLVCWLRSTLSATVIGQIQATMKGSMTITEYILKLRTLADTLAAAGQPMNDRDLLLNVLQGLGSECDAVIVNITSQQGVISQDAQFLLMSYEARLDQHASSSMSVNFSDFYCASSHNVESAKMPFRSCNSSHTAETCNAPLLCTYFGNKSASITAPSMSTHSTVSNSISDFELWHRKLGHSSSTTLSQAKVFLSFFRMSLYWLFFTMLYSMVLFSPFSIGFVSDPAPSLPMSMLDSGSCSHKTQQLTPAYIAALSPIPPAPLLTISKGCLCIKQ